MRPGRPRTSCGPLGNFTIAENYPQQEHKLNWSSESTMIENNGRVPNEKERDRFAPLILGTYPPIYIFKNLQVINRSTISSRTANLEMPQGCALEAVSEQLLHFGMQARCDRRLRLFG